MVEFSYALPGSPEVSPVNYNFHFSCQTIFIEIPLKTPLRKCIHQELVCWSPGISIETSCLCKNKHENPTDVTRLEMEQKPNTAASQCNGK